MENRMFREQHPIRLASRDIAPSGTEAAPDKEAADLLFGLARAQSVTVEEHQLVEAFAAICRAFEYYAGSGNVGLAVAAAEFPIAVPAFRFSGVSALMARGLALVPMLTWVSALQWVALSLQRTPFPGAVGVDIGRDSFTSL